MDDVERLILQPNTDVPMVRQQVDALGLTIVDEVVCREKRKVYIILVAEPLPNHQPLTPRETYLGPIFLARHCPLYLSQCKEQLRFLTDLKGRLGKKFPAEKEQHLIWLKTFVH